MSQLKQPLTAVQLKTEQEARENADRAARAKKEQEAQENRKRLNDEQVKAALDEIRRTWEDTVREAAAHEGARFCVVANILEHPAGVKEILAAIAERGFKAELVSGLAVEPLKGAFPPIQRHGPVPLVPLQSTRADACYAEHKHIKGWYPGSAVKKVGQVGTHSWLIVSWG
jgi:hypothetical protein